jgi:hypothetical protein
MKYADPEIQSLVLDLYAMHGTDVTVSNLSGVSRTTLWRMSRASEEGEPGLQECDWGGKIQPYHLHKLDALDAHIEDVQQRLTRDAGQGQWIPVVYGGFARWKEDEYAMSLSPKEFEDALELGVVWHDKMLRILSKTGVWERVPLMQYLPPTLEAQSKVLSSFAPETFGDRRKITFDGNMSLGVTVVGKQSIPPPEVMTLIKRPAITDQTEPLKDATDHGPDSEIVEPDFDDETMASRAAAVADAIDPEQAALLARMRKPHATALERDLAEKAKAKADEACRTNELNDDNDPRRTGMGTTSGYKIV